MGCLILMLMNCRHILQRKNLSLCDMLITLYVSNIFTANRTVHSNFLNDMPESTSELVLHYIFQLLTPGGFQTGKLVLLEENKKLFDNQIKKFLEVLN